MPIIALAPMVDRTDRHFRYLMRLLSKCLVLYTEMIVCDALIFGDSERHLAFDESQPPVVAQLAGNDPVKFQKAGKLVEQAGFNEINLNIGCPSSRVQAGEFGACLMAKPALVADCVRALKEVVSIPVTVKTRIGIDHQTDHEFLHQFTEHMVAAGCDRLIVHARQAWLKGLDPKQNRTIPPLMYPRVYRLKQEFQDLAIDINGGITSTEQIEQHLGHVDGVMIGRALYETPQLAKQIDPLLGGEACDVDDRIIIRRFCQYSEQMARNEKEQRYILRHLTTYFNGCAAAKFWRRSMNECLNSGDQLSASLGKLADKMAEIASSNELAAAK